MLKTVDLPLHRFLLYFLIVKSRSRNQNNQKWSFFFFFFFGKWWQSWTWNKLERRINFGRLRWGKMWKAVLTGDHPLSSFTTQLNQIVSLCLQETVLPWNWVSVQMAKSILSLCCMQMMCLVKLFSVYIHVHFMFETSVTAPDLAAFHFLGVFGVDACTAICLKI